MKKILWENLLKNIIVVFLLVPSYISIKNYFLAINLSSDKNIIGNLLSVVSILAVTACFGNFAFSYERIKGNDLLSRFIGHLTTGLLMLVIGISLEMTSILTSFLIGEFFIFNLTLMLLYIASVLYDFWDLKRVDLAL